MSKVEVDKVIPQSGTTLTIGDSGDTINLVGTLQSNGSPLPGDISSVVAGTGLSGGGTTGAVTLNIEAAQPTITSIGGALAVLTCPGNLTVTGNAIASAISATNEIRAGSFQSSNGDNLISISGTSVSIGATGDKITNFTSTGIDDNADATAITIDSSERVGVGETSPLGILHVKNADSSADVFTDTVAILENSGNTRLSILSGTSGEGEILFGDSGLNRQGRIAYRHNGDKFTFQTGNTERMTLTSTGLAIGTSSPSEALDVVGNANITNSTNHPTLEIRSTITPTGSTTGGQIKLSLGSGSNSGSGNADTQAGDKLGSILFNGQGTDFSYQGANIEALVTTGDGNDVRANQGVAMIFGTKTVGGSGFTEKMRLSAEGNLFIATTTEASDDVGHALLASGSAYHTTDGTYAGLFNRKSSDGEVVQIRKDNSHIGTIGVVAGDLNIYSTASNHGGLRFQIGGRIVPVNNSGGISDNANDLGNTNQRYKDLYLGGGIYVGGQGTANKLSDYEEGTWTPAYRGASSAGSYSTNASGTYTKVGNLVSVTAHLKNITQNSAGSGSIEIAGLPFAKSSSQESDIGSIYLNLFSLGGSDKYAIVNVNPSVSHVLITAIDSDGASASTLQLSARQSDSADMFFSVTYTT